MKRLLIILMLVFSAVVVESKVVVKEYSCTNEVAIASACDDDSCTVLWRGSCREIVNGEPVGTPTTRYYYTEVNF